MISVPMSVEHQERSQVVVTLECPGPRELLVGKRDTKKIVWNVPLAGHELTARREDPGRASLASWEGAIWKPLLERVL